MSMRGYGHDLDGIVDAALDAARRVRSSRPLDEAARRVISACSRARCTGTSRTSRRCSPPSPIASSTDPTPSRPPDRVRSPVADTAWALRAALLRHRDGAEVVVSTAALSLGSGVLEGRLRAAYEKEDPPDPARDATVLAQFLLGHTYLVQQRMQAGIDRRVRRRTPPKWPNRPAPTSPPAFGALAPSRQMSAPTRRTASDRISGPVPKLNARSPRPAHRTNARR